MDRSDRSASGLVFDLATALGELAGNAVSDMRPDACRPTAPSRRPRQSWPAPRPRRRACSSSTNGQQIATSADAASALDTFLEYIPEQMRVLLLAREELPWPLQKRYVHGQIAQLGDATLNLTYDELLEYIEQLGVPPESGERIFASTGGWVAGVAFASRFGVEEQPNLRDLSAYFGGRCSSRCPRTSSASCSTRRHRRGHPRRRRCALRAGRTTVVVGRVRTGPPKPLPSPEPARPAGRPYRLAPPIFFFF